ncbi:MAG: hypothetical protein ABJA78_02250 [Ferruginibacter sp.]
MARQPNDNATFHIGITMAGAGSAGCYTSGVMDYIFEALQLWEQAASRNLAGYEEFYDLIPQHNVMIDVMGGTSAGGITTLMSALYALNGNINPVTDPTAINGKKDNIFYDTWVRLDDDDDDGGGKKTLEKAWELSDLDDDKFVSLINSKVIDDVAERALAVSGDFIQKVAALPSYISKDLDILQVHTSLRGIPLAIDFPSPITNQSAQNSNPSHNSFEHFIVSHYKLNNGNPVMDKGFLWMNPYDQSCMHRMKQTTKATGAFPVGIKFRNFDQEIFTDEYIQCVTERTVFNRVGRKKNQHINWDKFPKPFNFVTIDGGAVNNEPFGEVMGILRNRYHQCYENGYAKYGIIMIDPFPDEVDTNKTYTAQDDLFSVIPAIIGTLYEQSKVKKDDLVEAAEHPYFRGEIFPRRWNDGEKDPYPIASASVGAFGGFLNKEFRHYDFFLGRDNAKNYLRYFFSFEYTVDETQPEKSIIHPIHNCWTPAMVELFKITGKDGKTYLPIIPDMNILKEINHAQEKADPFEYSVKDKPLYDPVALFEMREQMNERFARILDIVKKKKKEKDAQGKYKETGRWMEVYYHKNLAKRIAGWFTDKLLNLGFILFKQGIARNISELTVRWILSDLEKRNLLKKKPKE